jgi:hypothetical protein
MTELENFQLEPDALVSGPGVSARLPYDDILALLCASHHATKQARIENQVLPRGRSPIVAVRDRVPTEETSEQVLYIFRRSGAAPWILRESRARYTGLGRGLRPTTGENFATTVRCLRGAAPLAHYDERLMKRGHVRGVPDDVLATDIRAHVLAAHFYGGPRASSAPPRPEDGAPRPAFRADHPTSSVVPPTRGAYLDSSKASESSRTFFTFWVGLPKGARMAWWFLCILFALSAALKSALRDVHFDSHASQCKMLIEVINTSNAAIVKGVGSDQDDADEGLTDEQLRDIDEVIQSGKTTISEVPLGDAKLNEARRNYLVVLDEIWAAIQQVVDAMKRNDIPAMKAGLVEMKRCCAAEIAAVNAINRSCGH